ncbi:MAG: uL15 family ribosomal protein [Candidatus Pacearchaeota archaeon]|jgi:large subunit ribosomal protein L18e
MITKNQISKRVKSKTNLYLVRTINLAKKNNLLDLARKLSGPSRKQKNINMNQLNELEDKQVLIVGRVLGQGIINKKISIAALGFSQQAKEKLKKAGCEFKSINQEIEDNPTLKGVKIL